MNTTVTVSVRSVLVALALVIGLVAAYVIGASGSGGTPAQAATAPTAEAAKATHTITMTGSGDATGVPDEMTFKLSVGSTADDVSVALDQASGKMKQAIAALRKNGVEKKDTETTGLSIDPTYQYLNDQPPVLTGYRVRQSMSVHVRSLRGAGKALSAAVNAGGNSARISNLNLTISDVDSLLSQARDKAVEEATAKAKQYAEAAGQNLGDVVTLSEVKATPKSQEFSPSLGNMIMDRAAYKAVPIQAGSEKLDVVVSVVWELR
jgi:uncharacterized protein YggE